jgi:hypothetical protein
LKKAIPESTKKKARRDSVMMEGGKKEDLKLPDINEK